MLHKTLPTLCVGLFVTAFACAALAATPTSVVIDVHLISEKGIGKSIGTIRASETKNSSLLLTFNLSDELPPGGHGVHIHENASCARACSAWVEGRASRAASSRQNSATEMRASDGTATVCSPGMVTPDIKGGVRLGCRQLLSFRCNLLLCRGSDWRYPGPHCRELRALMSDLEQIHRFVRRPYD